MEPVIDFVTLTRSMGVDGIKAETPQFANLIAYIETERGAVAKG